MELVFVSSDKAEKSFGEYFGEMPWLALPFADRERKNALSKAFDVEGIPSLVVLSPVDPATGERAIVNKNARNAVGGDATGADFPWGPKPLEDLAATAECNGSDINESPALVLLMDGCDDATKTALKSAISVIAAEIADAGKASPDGPAAICFFATSGDGVVGRVRELCKLEAGKEPTLSCSTSRTTAGFTSPRRLSWTLAKSARLLSRGSRAPSKASANSSDSDSAGVV